MSKLNKASNDEVARQLRPSLQEVLKQMMPPNLGVEIHGLNGGRINLQTEPTEPLSDALTS